MEDTNTNPPEDSTPPTEDKPKLSKKELKAQARLGKASNDLVSAIDGGDLAEVVDTLQEQVDAYKDVVDLQNSTVVDTMEDGAKLANTPMPEDPNDHFSHCSDVAPPDPDISVKFFVLGVDPADGPDSSAVAIVDPEGNIVSVTELSPSEGSNQASEEREEDSTSGPTGDGSSVIADSVVVPSVSDATSSGSDHANDRVSDLASQIEDLRARVNQALVDYVETSDQAHMEVYQKLMHELKELLK